MMDVSTFCLAIECCVQTFFPLQRLSLKIETKYAVNAGLMHHNRIIQHFFPECVSFSIPSPMKLFESNDLKKGNRVENDLSLSFVRIN